MQKVLSTARVGGLLLLTALLVTPAVAADKDFDRNTVLLVSTDDMPAMKKAMDSSDIGAFMRDPRVGEIKTRMSKGLTGLIDQMMMSELGLGDDEAEREMVKSFSTLANDYWNAVWTNTTGRMSLAVGYRQGADGQMQPQFVCHHQGDETFVELHQRLMTMVQQMVPVLSPVTFSDKGVDFTGVSFGAPMQVAPGVLAPDGFYIGRKGNDYYCGLSREGLLEYVAAASGAESTAPRLGSGSFYQRAIAECGKGQLRFMINLEPIWSLVDMYALPMMGPDGAEMKSAMDALALQKAKGYFYSQSFGVNGIEQNGLFAVDSKDGLWSLLPGTNGVAALPDCVTNTALSAFSMRFNFEKLIPLVRNVARAVGGEEAVSEFNAFLAEGKEELGVSPDKFLAALEGTVLIAQPGGTPAVDGFDIGMAEAFVQQDFLLGMKLSDAGFMKTFIEQLMQKEDFKSDWQTETVHGTQMWRLGAAEGDVSAEDDFGPTDPEVAIAIDGDWLVFGLPAENVRASIGVRKGQGAQLRTDPRFVAALGGSGATGVGVAYANTGAMLVNGIKQIRPMLGFLPMLLGDMASDPNVRLLVDPANLPSAALVQQYFGVTTTTISAVPAGWKLRSWAPRVSPVAKPAKDKKSF